MRGDRRQGQGLPQSPIEGDWPYLWIDATYLKVRRGGRIVSVAVIIAVGVNSNGRREVLGMEVGTSEAEPIWTEFLRKLTRRGLRGVKPVVSDAHEGLKAAVTKVLSATWQRCPGSFHPQCAGACRQERPPGRLRLRPGDAASRKHTMSRCSAPLPIRSGRRCPNSPSSWMMPKKTFSPT
ncbi:transposase (plasmid) [Sinorhizobium medicae]|nr:transposase [Sinorhizobium medicae]